MNNENIILKKYLTWLNYNNLIKIVKKVKK